MSHPAHVREIVDGILYHYGEANGEVVIHETWGSSEALYVQGFSDGHRIGVQLVTEDGTIIKEQWRYYGSP